MAVFLFLVAILGGTVVGDLVLENPSADELGKAKHDPRDPTVRACVG
jgi:hypothetical protein